MRRVVNGVGYSTSTSDRIAQTDYEIEVCGEERTCWAVLFRTKDGAYFEHRAISGGKDANGEERLDLNRFLPMSESAAQKWVREGDVELIDDAFFDAPDATAETEASATMYPGSPRRKSAGSTRQRRRRRFPSTPT